MYGSFIRLVHLYGNANRVFLPLVSVHTRLCLMSSSLRYDKLHNSLPYAIYAIGPKLECMNCDSRLKALLSHCPLWHYHNELIYILFFIKEKKLYIHIVNNLVREAELFVFVDLFFSWFFYLSFLSFIFSIFFWIIFLDKFQKTMVTNFRIFAN